MTGPARYVAAEHDGRQYMTTGVPLVALDADEAVWLAARRQGIGASEIGSIAGVPGAFSSPFAVWWAKRLGWETERTFAMKVGTMLEPVIGDLFADEFPGVTVVRPSWRLFRHPLHPWMLASPDFLAVEQCDMCAGSGRHLDGACPNCHGVGGWVEPIECKSDEGRAWHGEPPPKHLMQTGQQMLVLGAPRGHLVRLSGKKLSAYVITPDASVTDTIITAGSWFARHLADATPPAVDGHPSTEDALRRLYPPVHDDDPHAETQLPQLLTREFVNAHDALEQAKARFAVARNAVRAAMTDARWAVTPEGDRIIEHRKYKKSGYEVKAHEVDEIRKAW